MFTKRRGKTPKGLVEIRDAVMWPKHIVGDEELRKRLLADAAGEVRTFKIDGEVLPFAKMADGKDGRPTPGFKPVGKSREVWKSLYEDRRGDLVSIEEV